MTGICSGGPRLAMIDVGTFSVVSVVAFIANKRIIVNE